MSALTLGALGDEANGYIPNQYSSKDNALFTLKYGYEQQNPLLSNWIDKNALITTNNNETYGINPVVNASPQTLGNVLLAHNIYEMDKNNTEPTWVNGYLKPAMYGVSALSTLGNLWLGFKNYSVAKKQLGLAEDQWNQTKQELNRIRALRTKLTNSYMNGE